MEKKVEKTIVLLVDDEASFLEMMKERLGAWGYACLTATSGRKALELIKHKKVHLVVLDYIMPEMDGLAVLKEIRKEKKKLPVILFTAHPSEKALQDAKKLFVSAFVPKLSSRVDVQTSLKAALALAVAQHKQK